MATSDPRVMAESFTVAADGSYAARLSASPGSELWYPERWTLGGPEPYAVPLPVEQPEEADSSVLPLADGRVLIARRAGPRYAFALLYPSGPDTGERRLGTVEAAQLSLLPPAPCGARAYALAPDEDERSTTVWLVAGGASGAPERVARVEGRCTGGAWLDREGRLLAVDRTEVHGGQGRSEAQGQIPGQNQGQAHGSQAHGSQAQGGQGQIPGQNQGQGQGPGQGQGQGQGQSRRTVTKTVVVDLGRGGEVSPLLQITEESNDRLLLADPYSGLLLVRSDAPGEDRLGWGVLGSHRPVRFPEVLHPAHTRLTPISVQPGQSLMPERCGVALRVGAATGTWLGVWRPGARELRHIAGPPGWLLGNGLWTADGELHVPYSTAQVPCGLARLRAPLPEPGEPAARQPVEPPAMEPPAAEPAEPAPPQAAQAPQRPQPPRETPEPDAAAASGAGAAREAAPGAPPAPAAPEPAPGAPQSPPQRIAPQAPPDPGHGRHAAPPDDVTGLQHRGHGTSPSGLLGSGAFRPVSTGSTGVFRSLAEPSSRPVPLQQAPLTTGTS